MCPWCCSGARGSRRRRCPARRVGRERLEAEGGVVPARRVAVERVGAESGVTAGCRGGEERAEAEGGVEVAGGVGVEREGAEGGVAFSGRAEIAGRCADERTREAERATGTEVVQKRHAS